MAYLVAADFRSGSSLNEVCIGLPLSTGEASDAQLGAAVTRLAQRIDDWTNDHFESESLTLEMDGTGTSRLYLPKRCTAVTSVKIRDEDGTLGTAEAAAVYRLTSSLYSSGSKRLDGSGLDYIDIVPNGDGLATLPAGYGDVYTWPCGPQTVQVVGTFGWTTTPGDIKRALALMVWDHFKPLRNDLRRSSRVSTADTTQEFIPVDPASGVYTGIQEADAIIAAYRRDSFLEVG